jgi:hypothetical protein
VQSTSGLYIESLDGLNLRRINNVADTFYVTAKSLLDEKLADTFRLIESFIQREMLQYGYGLNNVPVLRHWNSVGKLQTPIGMYQGALLLRRIASVSPLSVIYIQSLGVRALVGGIQQIVIQDAKTGIVLDTFAIDLIPSVLTEIEVKKHYDSAAIRIYIQDQTFQTYETRIVQSDCCGGDAMYRPVPGLSVIDEQQYGSKLIVTAGLKCTAQAVVCKILDSIADAVLHWFGASILRESIASERLNFFTIHSEKWAIETATRWEDLAKEAISVAVRHNLHTIQQYDKTCITCSDLAKPKLNSKV